MTPEESARLSELVNQIQVEQNPTKFLALVEELTRLLEKKGTRLTERRETTWGVQKKRKPPLRWLLR